jgi:hypothetical protein
MISGASVANGGASNAMISSYCAKVNQQATRAFKTA